MTDELGEYIASIEAERGGPLSDRSKRRVELAWLRGESVCKLGKRTAWPFLGSHHNYSTTDTRVLSGTAFVSSVLITGTVTV